MGRTHMTISLIVFLYVGIKKVSTDRWCENWPVPKIMSASFDQKMEKLKKNELLHHLYLPLILFEILNINNGPAFCDFCESCESLGSLCCSTIDTVKNFLLKNIAIFNYLLAIKHFSMESAKPILICHHRENLHL